MLAVCSLTTLLVAAEWKNSPKEGYILRDDDATNYSENGWRNINTLKHYHVPDNAVFRLVKRRDTPAPGRGTSCTTGMFSILITVIMCSVTIAI